LALAAAATLGACEIRSVVVILRRAFRKDVGLALRNFVRTLAFDQIEKLTVAVEVIEIFEQPEAVRELGDLLPRAELFFERYAFFFELKRLFDLLSHIAL
jgi:hypothetical protein